MSNRLGATDAQVSGCVRPTERRLRGRRQPGRGRPGSHRTVWADCDETISQQRTPFGHSSALCVDCAVECPTRKDLCYTVLVFRWCESTLIGKQSMGNFVHVSKRQLDASIQRYERFLQKDERAREDREATKRHRQAERRRLEKENAARMQDGEGTATEGGGR
jgi:hypothetical protein